MTTLCSTFDYLEQYKRDVENGKARIGEWMKLNFQFVEAGLKQKRFFYNPEKAEKAIRFIENYICFVEGKAGKFHLESWQKYITACIFGIVDKDDIRQFTEIVLIVGRKQGKSTFVAALEACVAYTQSEIGMQIYNLGPKLQQAAIIYDQVVLMIQSNKALDKRGKKRRSDYYIRSKNCKIAPLAFNSKKSDGFNPYFVCFDEFAAWEGQKAIDMYNVMLSGQGSRLDPINISCSTANYVDGGLYDEIYTRATSVLLGTSEEERMLPFLYQIDDMKKWDDPEELRKALPNLGVSFYERNLEGEIRKAHQSEKYKKEFITKYCNIKQNSTVAWLSDAQIKSTICDAFDMNMFYGMSGVGGADLSQTTDLTAACVVIRYEDKDYVLVHFWLPAETIKDASERDNIDYSLLVSHGFISLSGDKFVNYKDVTAWFVRIRNQYKINVPVVGYDRYSSTYFVDEMKQNGFVMDDVIQGTNLTPVLNEFEGLISDGKILTGNNGLMQVHLRNAAIQYVAGDNRMRLVKSSREKHIDGVAAIIDAMTVRSKYLEKYKWLLFGNKIRKKEGTE